VSLSGDANSDGRMNAADYELWRKSDCSNPTGYTNWRSYFGVGGGSGTELESIPGVPEPVTVAL
jgi:hypothetical protein